MRNLNNNVDTVSAAASAIFSSSESRLQSSRVQVTTSSPFFRSVHMFPPLLLVIINNKNIVLKKNNKNCCVLICQRFPTGDLNYILCLFEVLVKCYIDFGSVRSWSKILYFFFLKFIRRKNGEAVGACTGVLNHKRTTSGSATRCLYPNRLPPDQLRWLQSKTLRATQLLCFFPLWLLLHLLHRFFSQVHHLCPTLLMVYSPCRSTHIHWTNRLQPLRLDLTLTKLNPWLLL